MSKEMIKVGSTITFLIYLYSVYGIKDSENFIYCANTFGTIKRLNEDGGPEEISTESPEEKCFRNYCYTLWKEDPLSGNKTIMGQGCWNTQGDSNECNRAECLAENKPPKARNDTKFCCCSENMCNINFTDIYVPGNEVTPILSEDISKKSIKPFIWIMVFVSSIVLIIFAMTILYFWKKKPHKMDVEGAYQHCIPPPTDYSLDKLKLLNVIGQGRYGCVWRGIIDDQEIAVKVFAAHHRNYFINEHEMYKLSGENSALLKCFGGGEYVITSGGMTDYLLLLSLEQECLQDYLKNHTLDLITLSKMSLGIAKGLAHLHSDLGKPCIAHRDINTRNILVRADLTSCICDLGLAVVPKRSENKSISEAGTLRYMAPEVLEGAVNLRDCESALKQIDVYALGLVLWELGIRCADMQNSEPAPYVPPFHKEVGDNPTLEQMQTIVTRHKARPLWPPSWKDTVAARLLCETAEECWDQDAEARLTSLCVVERLLELPSLKGRVLHSLHPPASPTPLINNNHLHDHQIDSSVGTVETLLSPSEEHCKNSNQLVSCVTPLHPYQGRNPCLERNLLSGSSDSLLIDKSSKHCTNSEFENLITNDFLNYQINYRATPIPYLQNAVHGSPKQSNTSSSQTSKKFKWNGFLKLFPNRKLHDDDKYAKTTQVKLHAKLVNNFGQNNVTTTLLLEEHPRPSSLPLNDVNTNSVTSQIPQMCASRLKATSNTELTGLEKLPATENASSSTKKIFKKNKESARFSLYDDRIMTRGQWGSAPELEPTVQPRLLSLTDLQDGDSISSF